MRNNVQDKDKPFILVLAWPLALNYNTEKASTLDRAIDSTLVVHISRTHSPILGKGQTSLVHRSTLLLISDLNLCTEC